MLCMVRPESGFTCIATQPFNGGRLFEKENRGLSEGVKLLTLSKGSSYSGSEHEHNAFKELFFFNKEKSAWPSSKERF